MPAVNPECFSRPDPHVDVSDAQSILDDLSLKINVVPSLRNRVAPGSYDNKGGLNLDSATPLQLAHLFAFLNKNKYHSYVHIGRPTSIFPLVNEYTREIREDPHATILCNPSLENTLLQYSRHTFYKSTHISHSHDTFAKRLADTIKSGDLVTLDVGNDEVLGAVQAADMVLQRGAQLVLFNVADPNHPNVARVWKMITENRLLSKAEFLQSQDSVYAIGGGIGVTSLAA